MATITDYLNKILSSVYGKDVRQAIHDAIHQCYADGKAGSIDLVARENIDLANKRIDNLAKLEEGSTTGDAELQDVRVGADGTTYDSAGEAVRAQVNEIKSDLDNISEKTRNLFNLDEILVGKNWSLGNNTTRATLFVDATEDTLYTFSCSNVSAFDAILVYDLSEKGATSSLQLKQVGATGILQWTTAIGTSCIGIQFTKDNISKNDFDGIYNQLEKGTKTEYIAPESAIDAIAREKENAVENKINASVLLGNQIMITSESIAESEIGSDFDNIKPNKVYTIGAKVGIAHAPYDNFLGTVISYNYITTNNAGEVQIARSDKGGTFTRIEFGSLWSEWVALSPSVYRVGADYATSLSALLLSLKNDFSKKIIYVEGGAYDIFAEYRALQNAGDLPIVPEGTSTSDYYDYCVFLPPNTKLIGLGGVTLNWLPSPSQISPLESQIYSPLNVLGGCYVDNITIHCKNGRYCIHDDPQTRAQYHGKNHVYENVRCVHDAHDNGYGFDYATGFGFTPNSKYAFSNCTFECKAANNPCAFYGHGSANGANNPPEKSPSVVVKNCKLIAPSSVRTVFLQSLATVREHIITDFNSCFIDGGIHLQKYSNNPSATNPFDVTLLKSGNPSQLIDDDTNIYPIKVYE